MFIARGVIANNGNNPAWAGRYSYVSEPNRGFYQWDGLHKAKLFPTTEAALTAANEMSWSAFPVAGA